MMLEWVQVLVFPICALVAVTIIVLVQRGVALDDAGLLWSFGTLFSAALLLCYGLLQTDWLRFRLDPRLAVLAEFDARPAILELRKSSSREHQLLIEAMEERIAGGAGAAQALHAALPGLVAVARERMGFAGADAMVRWGKAELAALRELAGRDIQRCAALANSQGKREGLSTLAGALSAESLAAYEDAFAELSRSWQIGLRGPADHSTQRVSLNDLQARYEELRKPLVERHGNAVIAHLERGQLRRNGEFADARLLCQARIASLEAALEEPPDMASRLLKSMLR